MGKVVAGITISVDGYITGPDDGPGCGLGVGGERLHYWVFGGPWRYDSPQRGEPTGEDKAWLEETLGDNGAVIAGRGTYEAAGHWGDKNPWGIPFFVVTHHPGEQPPGGEFVFVGSLAEAVERATAIAGNKQVHVWAAPRSSARPWLPGWSTSSPSSSPQWRSARGNASSKDSPIRWSSSSLECASRRSRPSSITA